MKEQTINLESPAGFKEWLKGKAEDAVVGTAASNYSCPVARYLRDHNLPEARVFTGFYSPSGSIYESVESPAWMRCFVRKVDDNWRTERRVTARSALDKLEECEREMEEMEQRAANQG